MSVVKRRREPLSLNLTPLIDVVFLLLIFFMVTTTFTKESRLSLTLPEAEGEPVVVEEKPIEITVSADGSFAVNGSMLANQSVAGLTRVLASLAEETPDAALVLTADAMSPHQAVVTALDVAGQMGFINVSITTQKPE